MPLQQEIIDDLKKLSDKGYEIYIDRESKLSEENVEKIFAANSIDEIQEVIDGYENDFIDNATMYNDYKEEIKQDIINKYNLDSLDEDLMDELEQAIEDAEIGHYVDMDAILRNTGSVNLTIAHAAKENPKYWEDDFLMLPGMYRETVSEDESHKQNLSNVCAVLGIPKKEMEDAYIAYYGGNLREMPFELPDATIAYNERQTTAEKFIYDWENITTDYGVLSFMTKMDLDDYVKNYERIKKDGITVPVGAYVGLHDPMQGSCSLMEIPVVSPIVLKSEWIEISGGDNSHNHGYSLEEICGLSSSAWGPNKATIAWNEKEMRLITLLKDISEKNKLFTGNEAYRVITSAADFLRLSIDTWFDIDAREGLTKEYVQQFLGDRNKTYTHKEIPDESADVFIGKCSELFADYVAGEISKESLKEKAVELFDSMKEDQAIFTKPN